VVAAGRRCCRLIVSRLMYACINSTLAYLKARLSELNRPENEQQAMQALYFASPQSKRHRQP
jgi:hypothetical protein